jgi:hypothetical protein
VDQERREADGQKRAQAPTEQEGTSTASTRVLLAVTVLALVIFAVRPLGRGAPLQEEMPAVTQVLPNSEHEQRDGGSAGLGDGISAASVTVVTEKIPSYEVAGFAKEVPKTPLAGQRRPPCKPWQIEIRGGCWYEASRVKPPCVEGTYQWEGNCYEAVFLSQREPTSDEP